MMPVFRYIENFAIHTFTSRSWWIQMDIVFTKCLMFLKTVGGLSGAAPSGSPLMGPRMMGGATSPNNSVAGGSGFVRPPPPQQPSKPFDPFADLGKYVYLTVPSSAARKMTWTRGVSCFSAAICLSLPEISYLACEGHTFFCL